MSYPISLADEARDLGAAGYRPVEIVDVFRRRGVDPVPCEASVRFWLTGRNGGAWQGVRDPQTRARLAAGAKRAPLPLKQDEALERALELRRRGLTYTALSVVMGIYHSQWATESMWRSRLRHAGVEPRPHGRGNGVKRRVAA